jgi:hypothetical protein
MVLIYSDEKAWADMSEAEMGAAFAAYGAYSKALAEGGALRGGASLQPVATATCVRVRSGKTATTDGPFAETKEQLGGYYVIEVPNLDAALAWAAKCPGAAHGTVEVRPLGVSTAPDGGHTGNM